MPARDNLTIDREVIMNLFCFPFAGGSSTSYLGLQKEFNSATVVTLELPGRGRRFGDSLLTDMHAMVDDLFGQLASQLTRPYALYGHSMGASLAYLLTKRILDDRLPPPAHLFVSGRGGPSVPRHEDRHRLPRIEFLNMLKELGGSPPELLADDELMELFEPVLRADFCAVASYRHKETAPFDVPILVLHGKQDRDVTKEEALQWQRETTQEIDFVEFPGDHFFIFQFWPKIRQLFEERLKFPPRRHGP